jgi:hypothetical protein
MKVVLLGPKAITFAKPSVTQSEKEKKNFRIPQKFQDPTALANRSSIHLPITSVFFVSKDRSLL